MSSHNFSVGVTIHMIDRFTGQLGGLGNGLMRAHGKATGFLKELKNISHQMHALHQLQGVGNAMFNIGAGALQSLVDPAKEYAHQLKLMELNGMRAAEVQSNLQQAWKTSFDVISVNPTDALRAQLDLRTLFGNTPEALEEVRHLMPEFMKSKQILLAAGEKVGHGESADTMVFSMAKALEMSGKIRNKDEFKHHMDMMTRTMVATGGRVRPEDYQALFKMSRQAKFMLSEDFLYKVVPELIIENKTAGGGGSGGTGGPGAQIAAMFRLGVQGIINKASAQNLAKYGLLKDPILETTTTGTVVKGSGGLIQKDMLAANPKQWVNEVMMPHILKARPDLYRKDGSLDETKATLTIAEILKGNQMATSLIMELYNKRSQFKKYGGNLDAVPDSDTLYERSKSDPGVAEQQLANSLNTLRTAVAESIIPAIVPGINMLALVISRTAKFFHENPLASKILIAVAAGVMLSGAILIVVTGFGLLAGAAALIGVSATGLFAVVAAGVSILSGVVLAFLDWNNISRAGQKIMLTLNSVMRQGIIVFQQVSIAFAKMLGSMISGVYQGVINSNNLVRSLTGGMIGLDPKMLAANQDAAKKGVDAIIQNSQREISRQQLAIANNSAAARKLDIGQNNSKTAQSGGNTNIGTVNVNVKNGNPHDVKNAVIEGLSSAARKAGRSITTAGGAYTSSAHGGAH